MSFNPIRAIALCTSVVGASAAMAHPSSGGGKDDLDSGGGGGPQGGPFVSQNMPLLGHLTRAQTGGNAPVIGAGDQARGSDIWGWVDPVDGSEIALVGRSDGTAFVDVTDPTNPRFLSFLPSHTGNRAWRDIKTFGDYAYVTADLNSAHGIQIFDLTQLRDLRDNPQAPVFYGTSDYSVYGGINRAANLAVNESTGRLYAVGTDNHFGGYHILDLSDPTNPVLAGSYSDHFYIQDAQVLTYSGPDPDYQGREVAIGMNPSTGLISVTDLTDASAPSEISLTLLDDTFTALQGTLTADQRYLLIRDEADERTDPDINTTRMLIYDLRDLDAPEPLGYVDNGIESLDHMVYVNGRWAFEANYTSGLRVTDLSGLVRPEVDADGIVSGLPEVAFFDTHPSEDSTVNFDGAWGAYPFFPSGTIAIGDRDEGLILTRLELIEGDADLDGDVDLVDLDILGQNWGSAGGGWTAADFNGDAVINLQDLDLLGMNWGVGTSGDLGSFEAALADAGLPVPEPAAGAVLFLGLGLLRHRRRR